MFSWTRRNCFCNTSQLFFAQSPNGILNFSILSKKHCSKCSSRRYWNQIREWKFLSKIALTVLRVSFLAPEGLYVFLEAFSNFNFELFLTHCRQKVSQRCCARSLPTSTHTHLCTVFRSTRKWLVFLQNFPGSLKLDVKFPWVRRKRHDSTVGMSIFSDKAKFFKITMCPLRKFSTFRASYFCRSPV